MLAGFAMAAILLAAIGIYGVISYAVSQQSHEIGIRMALGASAGQVQARVVGRTLGLSALGILVGSLGSLAVARLVSPLLYGISANNPAALLATVALLTLVAAVAGYLPALRASRTDPAVVLRV